MEVVGEEGTAIDDLVTYLKAELYDFCYLQQNSFDAQDAFCPQERQIPLYQLINRIFDTPFRFATHDQARDFFLSLQNQIKNMNFMAYNSHEYKNAFASVREILDRQESEAIGVC